MKRVISVLLSIVYLVVALTILPVFPVFANEPAATQNTLEIQITDDSTLYAGNINPITGAKASYGGAICGADGELFAVSGKSANRGYGIFKTNFADAATELGEGRPIEKIEFVMNAKSGAGAHTLETNVNFYNASSNWDEATISMTAWENGGYTPALSFSGSYESKGYYGGITGTPAVTTATTFAPNSEFVEYTYDITALYNEAFADGVESSDILSFMMVFDDLTSQYWYEYIASSENSDASVRPKLKITFGEAATTPSEPTGESKEVLIKDDSTLYAGNINPITGAKASYGGAICGADEELFVVSGKSANRGYGIFKTDFADAAAELGEGRPIEKIEFVMNAKSGAGAHTLETNVNFYNASSNWDEATISMTAWENGGYTPALSFSGSYESKGYYGGITGTPAVTTATTFAPSSEFVEYTYDITALYNEAFTDGAKATDTLSFMMVFDDLTSQYWYEYIASSENSDASVRPKLILTFGDATDVPDQPDQPDVPDVPDVPADEIRLDVSEDTFMFASNVNPFTNASVGGYGNGSFGNEKEMFVVSGGGTNSGYGLFKIPFAALSDKLAQGKVIKNVEFTFNAKSGGGGHTLDTNLEFYNADASSWDEAAISMNSWIGNWNTPEIIFDKYSEVGYYGFIADEYDHTAHVVFPPSKDFNEYTVDITELFEKAYPLGATADDTLSFMMAFKRISQYWYEYIATSENDDESLRPYITVTLGDPDEFTESAVVLPESTSDEFILTMSNTIDSANIKVNGEILSDSDIIIEGKVLKFKYSYDILTEYNVDVDLKDIYNQSYRNSYGFETSYDLTEAKGNCTASYRVEETGSTEITGYGKAALLSDNKAHLYAFELPEVSDGYLETFEIKLWNSHSTKTVEPDWFGLNIYRPENDITDFASVKFSDISPFINPDAFEGELTANYDENETQEDSGSSYTAKGFKADLTKYANELIAEGKTKLYLIVYTTSTTTLLGNSYWMYSDAVKPCSVSAINSSPAIIITDKDIELSGNVLAKADVRFITDFDLANGCDVQLTKAGVKAEDAEFVFDKGTHTLGLKTPLTLDTGAVYELVIKKGSSDLYGNSLDADMVIQQIIPGKNLSLDVKRVNVNVTDKQGFDEAADITSVAVGDEVSTAVEYVNNGNEECRFIIFTANYGNDGSIKSLMIYTVVAPANSSGISSTTAIAAESGTVVSYVMENDTFRPLTKGKVFAVPEA